MAKSKYLETTHQAVAFRALLFAERAGAPIVAAGDMNAGKRGARASAAAKMTGLRPGEADLRVWLPRASVVMIEIKTETGRLSNDQREHHEKLVALGHTVELVKQTEPLETARHCCKIVQARLERLGIVSDWEWWDNHCVEAWRQVASVMGIDL